MESGSCLHPKNLDHFLEELLGKLEGQFKTSIKCEFFYHSPGAVQAGHFTLFLDCLECVSVINI